MDNIYKFIELEQLSFFQKTFKKFPKKNAFIEVNNMLAERPVKEIKIEEIDAISEKYKVDLHNEFADKLKGLYSTYLKECLSDNFISDKELDELNYLKKLLHLQDYEVEILHKKLAGEIYEANYNDVIIEGKILDSEKESLEKLQKNLRLSEYYAEEISGESRKQFVNRQWEKINEDKRLSPEEWEEFTTLAKDLEVNVTMDNETKEQIEKFKLYWHIEHGELPIKEVSIYLQQSERCYYTCNAEWFENRTVTKRINYGGPTARIKIMKGIYYKAGSMGVQRVTSEELQLIDHGQVYITNKRLIFFGSKKNTNIQLSKILSLNPYSDAVGIEKDTGRSPIIKVDENADLLAMVLSRVINDL